MYIDIYHILYGIECGMYRYIGAGSAREVYDLDNGFVIKVARNIKEQIEDEVQYPGTIKVTVIRETRATEEAK